MDKRPAPTLPAGDESTTLSTISQSLSFHSSPSAFLTTRQNVNNATPENSPPAAVKAKIINRNVAIVASYDHCKAVLDVNDPATGPNDKSRHNSFLGTQSGRIVDKSCFASLPAYKELMIDFFPQPNLLLLDAPDHNSRRRAWNDHMGKVYSASSPFIQSIATEEISGWQAGTEIDLYDRMKGLAWRMLLAVFLHLEPTDPAYQDIVQWQEELLRGQFSLFPVSIKIPFWCSPRARGLNARRKLQAALKQRLENLQPQCPFHCPGGKIGQDELASNALLFTSSLAIKALASLLTASLLNLFLFPGKSSLASQLRELDPECREALMRSILCETERLSPPVIGVMRRVQQDIVLQQPHTPEEPSTLIPQGWDAWLYLVGANRNEAKYAEAGSFVPERFAGESEVPPPLAFGVGDKSCLGRDLVRQIVQTVATVVIESGIDLHGSLDSEGTRGWLGWDPGVSVESMARDMKQLPCQRPRKAIRLRVSRSV